MTQFTYVINYLLVKVFLSVNYLVVEITFVEILERSCFGKKISLFLP